MKISGYSETGKTDVAYFKCPNCGNLSEWITQTNDKKYKCLECNHIFEDLKQEFIKEKYVICAECGNKITLTPTNFNFFYSCDDPQCSNKLAIPYKNELYQPLGLLETDWNKNNVKKGIEIENNLKLVFNNDEKNIIITKMLNAFESSFLRFKPDSQKSVLLYNDSNVIGYIIWSENDDKIILRQIFIYEPFRCHGYATILIKEWFNHFVLDKYDNFGVESPKSIIVKILTKLDYLSLENNEEKMCYLVSS